MTEIIVVLIICSVIICSVMFGIVAFINHKINITECNILDCSAQLYKYLYDGLSKKESEEESEEPTPTVQILTSQLKFYKNQNEQLLKTIDAMSHALAVHENTYHKGKK